MKGIRIRPELDGLRASLFDLEAEIMELVWAEAWPEFSVSDVHQKLEQRRRIAYTTVMTTVSRLFDKEVLSRRKDGRRYLYAPTRSRSEFITAMTQSVFDSLVPGGRRAAYALLVDRVAEADEEDLERLEALIREKRMHTKRDA